MLLCVFFTVQAKCKQHNLYLKYPGDSRFPQIFQRRVLTDELLVVVEVVEKLDHEEIVFRCGVGNEIVSKLLINTNLSIIMGMH